jgi:hypothetical protein
MSKPNKKRIGYHKIDPLWERLLGMYAAASQQRGYLVREQEAAEEAIYRFLARFPEAVQPEDVTQLEVACFLQKAIVQNRSRHLRALDDLKHLQDFWDFLRYQQGYFLADPFETSLRVSRWSPVAAERRSRFSQPSKLAESDSCATGQLGPSPPLP